MINMVPVFMMQQQVLRQQREHARKQAEHQRQMQLRQTQLKREEDKQEYLIKDDNVNPIVFHSRKELI